MADENNAPPPLRLLVVIPAYNEAASIAAVLDELRRDGPHADVLVVDDGSADSTAAIAAARGAAVLRLPFNLGIGAALQTGYQYALANGYAAAVQFDADGQHRADQIAALIEPLRRGRADHVIGSRTLAGAYRFPLPRLLGACLIRAITLLVTGRRISDPTSGFRAYGPRALAFFARQYPQAYLDSAEITVWALRQGMRVEEVPAEMRPAARSSIGSLMGVVHALRVCLALLIDRMEKPFAEPPAEPPAGGPPRTEKQT